MDELPGNLPPELDAIGERMRAERPVADNHSLDRVMTRAQSARQAPKRLWRSPAPRTVKKSIIAAFTVLVATAGVATAASAFSIPGLRGFNLNAASLNISALFKSIGLGNSSPPSPPAAAAQYACDPATNVFVGIELLNSPLLQVVLDGLFPGDTVHIQQVINLGNGQLQVVICINI